MHFGDGVDNVRVRAASTDVAAHALAELIDRQKRLRDQVGKAQLKKQYKPLDEMSRKIERDKCFRPVCNWCSMANLPVITR